MDNDEDKYEQTERVARAICAARWTGKHRSLWEIINEDEREDYRRMARAALEAMAK